MIEQAIADARQRYENVVLDLAWHIHEGRIPSPGIEEWFISQEVQEEAALYVEKNGVDAAIARIGG